MSQKRYPSNGESDLSSSPDWASLHAKNSLFQPPSGHEANGTDFVRNSGHHEEYDEGQWNDDVNSDNENDNGPLLVSGPLMEDYTLEFFRPAIQSDQASRAEGAQSIVELLKASLETVSKDLIKNHLLTVVRFAYEAPFDDLQETFQGLLKIIEKDEELRSAIPKSLPNPSTFIHKSLFPPVNTKEDPLRTIFVDVFLQAGRVSHLSRVLALHPSYFECYHATYNFIMREPGPLPVDWRNYIAILAAARHKCRWLVDFHEQEFISVGGKYTWLLGVDYIPKKILNLLEVNQILAHQPWLITRDHIASLVKGEDSWSIGELVHAIIIICTIKSLAGLIFGCGVTPEIDFKDERLPIGDTEEEEPKEGTPEVNILADTQKLTELLIGGWESNEPEEQQESLFVKAETLTSTNSSSNLSLDHLNPASSTGDGDKLAKFIGRYNLQHVDFDTRANNYNIFRIQDYGWKEDGFELVRRFLPGCATLLDEEFDHIYTMTYNMFNQNKDIDTFPFRRAIWQYVQRIKGMFHDDYNYQEVNIFLNRSTKSYVKKLACYSYVITKNDYKNLGYELRPDEKVHVAILAVESAKQSELLYGLHAVMKHMYNSD